MRVYGYRVISYDANMVGPILSAGKAYGRVSPPDHPEPAELQRFMRAESSRAEARAIVRHLLARCPQCLQVTRRLWGLGDRVPREEPQRKP